MKLEKYKWTLPKNKIVVGLTGGICSGKSEVLKIFKNLGATTLSADDISAKILSSNKQVKAQISKKFGEKFTKKLLADKKYLDQILLEGVEKANLIASKKIDRIKEIVGF